MPDFADRKEWARGLVVVLASDAHASLWLALWYGYLLAIITCAAAIQLRIETPCYIEVISKVARRWMV